MNQTSHNLSIEQKRAIEHCKRLVEEQLAWGSSARWASKDFEELSVRIQEKTSRSISETTLKRLWGHIPYNSRPSRHSLTTLAAFLDYPSWRAFATSIENENHLNKSAEPYGKRVHNAGRPISRTVLYVGSFIGVVILLWLGVMDSPTAEPAVAVPEGVTFRSRTVAQNIPNTVIFDYDVRGVSADSFFIQQSWDQRRRTSISPHNQTHTSIYYRPGFFNAKLIANDSVIKEHPVHVTTEGWLALIEKNPVPIYLRGNVQQLMGSLSLVNEQLRKYGYDTDAPQPGISFYNVREFGTLHTDYFYLETILRGGLNNDRYPCQHAEVSVIGERSALNIPLGVPGCVSEMGLMLGDIYLSGSSNDLSSFGTNLSKWQPIVCEVKSRKVTIQVGSNAPFTTRFNKNIGKVVGLRFSFEDSGSVKYVVLKNRDGIAIYENSFEGDEI